MTDRPSPMTGPSFVAVDVETANRSWGSICAIGLSVVRDGRLVESHDWRCRPPAGMDRFDPFNIRIHGITAAEVARAPSFADRFADLVEVTGGLPLVAHNATFDITALRKAGAAEDVDFPVFAYGCTVAFARKDLPALPNHKLPTVSAALQVELRRHHDASADADAAALIALELMRRRRSADIYDYADAAGVRLRRADLAGTAVLPRARRDAGTGR